MSNSAQSLMNYIRVIAGAWRDDPREDADLLAQFVETRDERAFATLMWRHGPMVWRSCTHVLGNCPDAEDAFQSTFLTMSKQAGKLRANTLAGWLYRIARRAALDTAAETKRRRNFEQHVQTPTQSGLTEVNRTELSTALDEELAILPEKLRIPLLLHYLEGRSQVEVARILGCARRALQKRLQKGEAILRGRLERRGLTLGVVSVATLLSNATGVPAMPGRLIESVARAAVAFNAGTLADGVADGARKLLRSLAVERGIRKLWWVILACVSTLGLGETGLVVWKMFGDGSDFAKPEKSQVVLGKTVVQPCAPRVDCYGDPLPEGAVARIGTVRFRAPGGPQLNGANRNLQTKTALSADGRTIALACSDGLYFWNLTTGKQLRKIIFGSGEGHVECMRVVYSPDNKLLATVTDKKDGITLLDSATGKQVEGAFDGNVVLFTPDGKIVACGHENREGTSFNLYDVSTRELLHTVSVKQPAFAAFSFAAFSPNARVLAYVESVERTGDGTVHLLDVETGKETVTLKERQVVALAFSSDSNVVTGGKDKVIRVWDGKTGKEIRQLGTMEQIPTLVEILPDQKTVLAVCAGRIYFWDIATGKETRPSVTCKGLMFPTALSSDGTKLIERVENTVSLWDVGTGRQIGPAAGAPRSLMSNLVFSPDNAVLAASAERTTFHDNEVTDEIQEPGMAAFSLWDAATGKPLGSLPVPDGTPLRGILQATWPSGDSFFAQGYYGTRVPCRNGITRWTKGATGWKSATTKVYQDGLKISPDCQIWAHRTLRDNFEFVQVSDGKKLSALPSHIKADCGGVRLAFSADHQLLATQLSDEMGFVPSIMLWETSTGCELYSFNLPDVFPRQSKVDELIGFSPDGRLIATQINNDGINIVSFWEHVSGRLRLRLSMPVGSLVEHQVAFSSDNRLVAAGCVVGPQAERSIRIWDLATGQENQQFHGHRAGGDRSIGVAFSPDGRRLASAGGDYTVLVWDVKQPPSPQAADRPLSRKELLVLKEALTGSDAEAAHKAIWKLSQVPEQALPILSECLQPEASERNLLQISQEISHLVIDLDSDDFQTRSKASKKLAKILKEETKQAIVEKILQRVLTEKQTAEVRKTIQKLLAEMKNERENKGWGGAGSPELTRMIRAVEVLEKINNSSTCELLAKLAKLPPRPEIRHEAEAALKRLKKSMPISTP